MVSWADDQDKARRLLNAGNILPLEKIIMEATRNHGTSVLEVELEQKDSRYFYNVQLLDPSGVVWVYKYDATTGKLLGKQKGE